MLSGWFSSWASDIVYKYSITKKHRSFVLIIHILLLPRYFTYMHADLISTAYWRSTHSSFNCQSTLTTITLSPPIAAYMHQWIGTALVQIMACRLFGVKPLSKPMLGYCQLDAYEQTSAPPWSTRENNQFMRYIFWDCGGCFDFEARRRAEECQFRTLVNPECRWQCMLFPGNVH